MNKKLGFGIFGLLVVGAVAAAPLLVAGQVENMVGQGLIDKTLATLPGGYSKAIRVTKNDFSKGYITSSQDLTLSLGCDPKTATEIKLHNDIDNGPFPGFKGFGAAQVRTKLVLDDKSKVEVEKLLGVGIMDKLVLTTDLELSGAGRSQLIVPKAGTPEVSWEEMKLTSQFTPGNTQSSGEFLIPALTINSSGTKATVKNLKAVVDSKLIGKYLTSGNTSYTLEQLDVETSGTKVTLEKLAVVAAATPQGSNIDFAENIDVGSLKADQFTANNVKLHLSINKAPQGPLEELITALAASQDICNSSSLQNLPLDKIKSQVDAVLSANPEFNIDEFSFNFDGMEVKGDAQIKGKVSFPSITTADLEAKDTKKILDALKGTLSIKANKTMVDQWVDLSGPSGTEQLAAFVTQGFIKEDSGNYVMELERSAGKGKINGKDSPI